MSFSLVIFCKMKKLEKSNAVILALNQIYHSYKPKNYYFKYILQLINVNR